MFSNLVPTYVTCTCMAIVQFVFCVPLLYLTPKSQLRNPGFWALMERRFNSHCTTALLPCCLSNFRAIGISQLPEFTKSYGKMAARLVNKGPDRNGPGGLHHLNTTTLYAHNGFKSPTTQLQANNKDIIKDPHYCPPGVSNVTTSSWDKSLASEMPMVKLRW